VGNAESLPFMDGSFDAYVANLCLMLVDNHKNQLHESFRVLKPGSMAAFSVWGRRERTAMFTLFDKCIRELGVDFVEPPRSNFYLGEDPQILVRDMREAGFTNVRYWYQMSNMTHLTYLDFWSFEGAAPKNQPKLKALEERDPEGIDKLKALLQERWAQLSEQGEFTLFENLIVVCQKPE
jgi:SAM-dependent methyltransferase